MSEGGGRTESGEGHWLRAEKVNTATGEVCVGRKVVGGVLGSWGGGGVHREGVVYVV